MHGHMNLNKERKSTLIMFFISDPYNGTINNQPTQWQTIQRLLTGKSEKMEGSGRRLI